MQVDRRVAGTAALLLIGLAVACSEPEPPPEVLRPVRTQTVLASTSSRVRTFSGTARAGIETQLSFRVAGTVDRVAVKVGDEIRAGQEIARLDQEDYRIAVRRADATLAQAEAALRNGEAELERVRGLWENQNASQGELDAALAAAQSARAQAEGARQALEAARNQLSYTVLKAPVDGAIASVGVESNENVRQGQTVVLLTSGERLEVEVAIPEVVISRIEEGERVTVTFDALPGRSLDAVVTEVGVASTGGATTFPVKVRLTEGASDVRPGMAAEVEFRFEPEDGGQRIYLPTHAVGADREGRFVFVVEPSGEQGVSVVHRRPVEVGELTSDGLAILSGLDEDEVVVTAGVRRLHDGQRVAAPAQGS